VAPKREESQSDSKKSKFKIVSRKKKDKKIRKSNCTSFAVAYFFTADNAVLFTELT
jgi:hypothetical protein